MKPIRILIASGAAFAATAATFVWTACETPLAAPSQLTDPRVLAIR